MSLLSYSSSIAATTQSSKTIARVITLLQITFGLVPIVAGLDKFTNLLTQWEIYLHPTLVSYLPFSPQTFMIIVGVMEILAGILVLRKPAFGGYVVAAWLVLIALTLLASGQYLDIAVRDIVMAVGSFALAQLSGAMAVNHTES